MEQKTNDLLYRGPPGVVGESVCQRCAELQTTLDATKRELGDTIHTLTIKLGLAAKFSGVVAQLEEITDAEVICIQQINWLREKSDKQPLAESEVKSFDILHKNLRMIRDKQKSRHNNTAGFSDVQLIDIANGGERGEQASS